MNRATLARLLTRSLARIAVLAACAIASTAHAESRFEPWQESFFEYLEVKYGVDARARFRDLEGILAEQADKSTMRRLDTVNAFFNELPWIADEEKWRQADYWATMEELIGTFGGDCEDMVLAKYTALRALGIGGDNLALVYASLTAGGAHMVLTYFGSRGMESLVLDNLNPRILPLGKRRDLKPVYSFNHQYLWQIDSSGRQAAPMPAARLKKWVHWKRHHAEMLAAANAHNGGHPVLPPLD